MSLDLHYFSKFLAAPLLGQQLVSTMGDSSRGGSALGELGCDKNWLYPVGFIVRSH
jgi:hypothetical protein